MRSVEQARHALAAGRTTAVVLTEAALARIADPVGEGARTFVATHAAQARATANAMDALRAAGCAPSSYAGIPVTVKDLFDETGVVTRAGSRAMGDAPPATSDATVLKRLRQQGFIVLGRTNMSEFAFSGLGANPHFGTPSSPWDRATGRLPGGSSSGAAVAMADGIGFGGLGTDTGGSCRIPAALCGVVGWKPTARRVPRDGVLPLSPTLDSVGLLTGDVASCIALDGVIADAPAPSPPHRGALRLGVPRGTVLTEGMDAAVGRAFERALIRLAARGAQITLFDLPELAELPALNATGGFAASEAWAWHRRRIARAGDCYDPMIRTRIERGQAMPAVDYIELLAARDRLRAAVAPRLAAFDAVLGPTVPIIAPPIAAVADPAEYNRLNMLLLRNPAPWNFFDCCAISLPMHAPGEAPTGLMLIGEAMADGRILGIAHAVEAVLSGGSRPPA